MVQPRGTSISNDASALIDAYSQKGCPADCGEDWKVEHIKGDTTTGTTPLI